MITVFLGPPMGRKETAAGNMTISTELSRLAKVHRYRRLAEAALIMYGIPDARFNDRKIITSFLTLGIRNPQGTEIFGPGRFKPNEIIRIITDPKFVGIPVFFAVYVLSRVTPPFRARPGTHPHAKTVGTLRWSGNESHATGPRPSTPQLAGHRGAPSHLGRLYPGVSRLD